MFSLPHERSPNEINTILAVYAMLFFEAINAITYRFGGIDILVSNVGYALQGEITKDDYMAGNLLKKEVEAHHVAEAFIALAKSMRTTAHIMTVGGGNIDASLR